MRRLVAALARARLMRALPALADELQDIRDLRAAGWLVLASPSGYVILPPMDDEGALL